MREASNGVSDIANSVHEQNKASTEIAQNIERIAHASEQNHVQIADAVNDIRHLEKLAQDFEVAIGRFRV